MDPDMDVVDLVEEVKYECGICLKEFSTSMILQTHIMTHKDDSHTCDQCQVTFPGFLELDEHLQSHHSLNCDSEVSDDKNADAKENPGKDDLHIETLGSPWPFDDKNYKFQCKICNLKFKNRNQLLHHLKLTNNGTNKEEHLALVAVERQKKQNKVCQKLLGRKCDASTVGRFNHSETNKLTERHRCRVCTMGLPQSMKLQRAHVRKHLLVKLNKRVYHVWKYIQMPRRGDLKNLQMPRRGALKSGTDGSYSTKPEGNKVSKDAEAYNITPPVSDEEVHGNRKQSVVGLVNLAHTPSEKYDGETGTKDRQLRKGKHPREFRCSICGDKFKKKKDLEFHYQNVHPGKKTCTKLKSKNPSKKTSWFTCDTCGAKIRGKAKFLSHLTVDHNESLKQVSMKLRRFSDVLSAGDSTNTRKLVQGVSKHFSKGPWFMCKDCKKRFKGRKRLDIHKRNAHRSSEVSASTIKDQNLNTDLPKSSKDQNLNNDLSKSWRNCCEKSTCAWFVCTTCDGRFKGRTRIGKHVTMCSRSQDDSAEASQLSEDVEDVTYYKHEEKGKSEDNSLVPCSHKPRCSWFSCSLCNKKIHGKKQMTFHFHLCQNGYLKPTSIKHLPGKHGGKHPRNENAKTVQVEASTSMSNTEVGDVTSSDFTKHKNGPWFRCKVCDLLIKGKSNLKHHKHFGASRAGKPMHPGNKNKSQLYTSGLGISFDVSWCWYLCRVCGMKIRGLNRAKNHNHEAINTGTQAKCTKILPHSRATSSLSDELHTGKDSFSKDETSDWWASAVRCKSSKLINFIQWGNWYRCTICYRVFKGIRKMESHYHPHRSEPFITGKISTIDSSDVNQVSNSANNSQCRQYWECRLCSKLFLSKVDFVAHTTNHKTTKTYSCHSCQKSFLTKSGLKLHLQLNRKEHSTPSKSKTVCGSSGDKLMQAELTEDGCYLVRSESFSNRSTNQTSSPEGERVRQNGWTIFMEFDGNKLVETSGDLPALDFYGDQGKSVKEIKSENSNEKNHSSLSHAANACLNDEDSLTESKLLSKDKSNAGKDIPTPHAPNEVMNTDSEAGSIQKHQFRCPTCGFIAASSSNLKRHNMNKHTFSPVTARSITRNIQNYVSLEGKMYRCDICCKQFEAKKVVKQHVRQHIVKQFISEKKVYVRKKNDLVGRNKSETQTVNESENEELTDAEEAKKKQSKTNNTRFTTDNKRSTTDNTRSTTDNTRSTTDKQSFTWSPQTRCTSELASGDGNGGIELPETVCSQASRQVLKKLSCKLGNRSRIAREETSEDQSVFKLSTDHSHHDQSEVSSESHQLQEVEESSLMSDPQGEEASNLHLLVKGEFICQICYKSFATNITASEHVLSHYASNSQQPGRVGPQISYKVCGVCGENFRSTEALQEHEGTHSDLDRLKSMNTCNKCGMMFESQGLLEKHRSIHHFIYFKCPQCSSFFIDYVSLNLHILRMKHFLCSCGEVFISFDSLDWHNRMCSY